MLPYVGGNSLATKFPMWYCHESQVVRYIPTRLLVSLIVSFLVIAWASSGEAAQLIDLGANTLAYNFSANGQYICGSAYRSGDGPFPVIWSVRALQRHPANPNAAERFLNIGGIYSFGEARGMGVNGNIAGTLSSNSNLAMVGSDQPVSWNASNAASITGPTDIGTSGRASCISPDGTTIVANEASTFSFFYGQNYGGSITGTSGQVYACSQNGTVLAGASGSSAEVWQSTGGVLASIASSANTSTSWFASSWTGVIFGGQVLNSGQITSVFGMPQVSNISSSTITSVNSYQALLLQHAMNSWTSDEVFGLNNSGSIAVGQYYDSSPKPHGFRATFDKDSGSSTNDSSALTIESWISYKGGNQYSGGGVTSGLVTYNAVGTDFEGDAVVGQLNNSGSAGDAYLAIDSAGL